MPFTTNKVNDYQKSPLSTALNSSFQNGLAAGFWGAVGYALTGLSGLSAPLQIGSWTAMASTCFVGAALLTIPLHLALLASQKYNIMPEILFPLADHLLLITSAALGAAVFSLAIKPFVICAAVLTVTDLTIKMISSLFSLLTKPNNSSQNDKNQAATPAPKSMFFSAPTTPSSSPRALPEEEVSVFPNMQPLH